MSAFPLPCQVFCTKALPACGTCPLAPQCEYAQQGGRRLAEGDAAPPAAAAAPTLAEQPAQAARVDEAPATPVPVEHAKAAAPEPAAPDTPPRVEAARPHGRSSPQAKQQGARAAAAPPLPDIEDSLGASCTSPAVAVAPASAAAAPAMQSAISAAAAGSEVQEGQCEPPVSRAVTLTQAMRDAAVQRILSGGDSRPSHGPSAASKAERLAWYAIHIYRRSKECPPQHL